MSDAQWCEIKIEWKVMGMGSGMMSLCGYARR